MISSPGCVCLEDVTPRVEFDDRLDDFASWDAEIVPLEIDAGDSCLLRPRHVQNHTARDDDDAPTTTIRVVLM